MSTFCARYHLLSNRPDSASRFQASFAGHFSARRSSLRRAIMFWRTRLKCREARRKMLDAGDGSRTGSAIASPADGSAGSVEIGCASPASVAVRPFSMPSGKAWQLAACGLRTSATSLLGDWAGIVSTSRCVGFAGVITGYVVLSFSSVDRNRVFLLVPSFIRTNSKVGRENEPSGPRRKALTMRAQIAGSVTRSDENSRYRTCPMAHSLPILLPSPGSSFAGVQRAIGGSALPTQCSRSRGAEPAQQPADSEEIMAPPARGWHDS